MAGGPGTTEEPLARVRALCRGFPEVTERLSHGDPTWFVQGKRTFVMFADHHHDDRLAVWCAAPDGVQQALAAADSGRFFRPPYVGVRGWLGVWLDVDVDWGLLAGIITDAYMTVAPARLVATLASAHRPGR